MKKCDSQTSISSYDPEKIELLESPRESKKTIASKEDKSSSLVRKLTEKIWDKRYKLISYDELPEWAKDNEHIVGSYRPILPSFLYCFSTIFRVHNETVNIWSHLLGFIMFVYAGWHYLLIPSQQFIDPFFEKATFILLFAGSTVCLGFSWTFHTMGCHSSNICCIFAKLDYSGIAIMIMSSCSPWIYYIFYCDTMWRQIYIGFMSFLGLLCVAMSQSETFAKPRFRSLRATVFSVFGVSAVVPMTHGCFAYGFLYMFFDAKLSWLLLMGAFYLVGAFIYANRIPEKWAPGKFDLWFNSHQIFHIFSTTPHTNKLFQPF